MRGCGRQEIEMRNQIIGLGKDVGKKWQDFEQRCDVT